MADIQMMVDDLQYRLREQGIMTIATHCLSADGKIVSFELKITGYCD